MSFIISEFMTCILWIRIGNNVKLMISKIKLTLANKYPHWLKFHSWSLKSLILKLNKEISLFKKWWNALTFTKKKESKPINWKFIQVNKHNKDICNKDYVLNINTSQKIKGHINFYCSVQFISIDDRMLNEDWKELISKSNFE